MRHSLFGWLLWSYVVLVAGLAVVILLAGLRAALVDRWEQYLATRMAPLLADERRRHADQLEDARRQHRDAQAWLMETHRGELDRAVAQALTSVAPHPRLRAS